MIGSCVYHITDVANLSGIIQSGIRCDSVMSTTPHRNGAHRNIKNRRKDIVVPVPAGGTLDTYVPFYFAPRSPMLCAIHHKNVENARGQEFFVHLEIEIQSLIDLGTPYAFTNRCTVTQPPNPQADYYDDIKELNSVVDWDVMRSQQWASQSDKDMSLRRKAEFLVKGVVPWSTVRKVGVMDEQAHALASTSVQASSHKPPIEIIAGWYYA